MRNDNGKELVQNSEEIDQKIQQDLSEALGGGNRKKYSRFVLAALGSIPWVGGFLAASSAIDAENEQENINKLTHLWLKEHQLKIQELGKAFIEILSRVEGFGEEIQDRIESPQYLSLVRQGFREWDQSETQEKRDLIRRLLTNAGATVLCPDDLVRLFLDWINRYHEAHFLVIKQIYQNPGISRGGIWDRIHGERPREDSAEADLFKLLIRDLSMGSVIRQHRPTNASGQYLKQPTKKRGSSSGVMKSAFDDSEPYELTELGSKFVHYTMEDVVQRVES
ncbi:hypothetical protein ACFOEK_06965 [Litoribrevibacter euphylliae]|uniref:Uncharacterized protein n=1 Tax=Litoribrevibacter euphylliae TaxID=1834034 RepID=A0ABV7HGU1_9GAMM